MKETKIKSSLLWAVLLGTVFLAALGSALWLRQGDVNGKVARIYREGVLVCEIDLANVENEYEFAVESADGSNTIQVRSGAICVSDADCGDQTCVRQGWLSGGMTPIVCLPHQLVIQLEEAADEDFPDVIVGAQNGGGGQ